MAQSGYTPILIYASGTASNVPLAANLTSSANGAELALNYADGKLYFKNSGGTVTLLASSSGIAGGSNTQVQYNSSGSLAGSANMTFNGTSLTLANDASINGLTVGKGANGVTYNTALGNGALSSGSLSGNYNTGIGALSLQANTSGTQNQAFGYAALNLNTTGSYNFAGGTSALTQNTTGAYNTALGTNSLYSNTTASYNIAVGYQAGYTNTAGGYNVFIGFQAGYLSNGAAVSVNTAVGTQAGSNLSTGTYNSFFGYFSGQAITTGSKNSILGSYSGNQGGLDIRTASNYIVLSDGDGNPRQIIDSSGNLGLGVTPSAWGSGYKSLEVNGAVIQASANNKSQAGFGNNYYNNGTNYIYSTTNYASLYFQNSGQHIWYNAPSGTAGNAITFTQAMTLDNSGNLLVGITSASGFAAKTIVNRQGVTGAPIFTWTNNANNSGHTYVFANGSGISADGYLAFGSNEGGAGAFTERMRIDSSGNVLVTGVGGLGYGTGSGGAVTQITSRTTGVTLNKTNGAITLFTAAGLVTATTFTVTNSTVAATDVIHVCQKSGTNLYNTLVTAVAAGSFNITFYTTGGVASDAPVFNFTVIKAVTA